MNYIGAKNKLSSFLSDCIETYLRRADYKDLSECVFCDLFAGSGAVGRQFSSKTSQIIANDIEFYSFVLNNFYLNPPNYALNCIIKDLNKEEFLDGKIYKYYAPSGGFNRQYFSDFNAKRIDFIRNKIEYLKPMLDLNDYYALLAILLEASDKIANTASVYAAFLKDIKASAQKKIVLKPLDSFLTSSYFAKSIVYNEDSLDLIKNISGDILYLDPPYNSREYGANYHLLNTIALYDDFIPRGKTGLRDYKKSPFCKIASVESALESIIKNANFKWIFLSYNDEGLLDSKKIKKIFMKYGKYNLESKIYQRFKADSARTCKKDSTIEYLHILQKY